MIFAACEDTDAPPEVTVRKLVTEKLEAKPADYAASGLVKSITVTDFNIVAYGDSYTSYSYNYGDWTIYPVRVEINQIQGWEQYGGEIENRSVVIRYNCTFDKNSYGEWEVQSIKEIGE